jgi:hypothetical protein
MGGYGEYRQGQKKQIKIFCLVTGFAGVQGIFTNLSFALFQAI